MPNRIIKESICSSDSLNLLSDFEENLFYKLIVNCDDYGRFDARPAILKSRCYPLRDRLTLKNIEDALSSLARVGCVELYKVDGKPYLRLPTWEVHQQIRAKKSKFPEPDSNGYQMISSDGICLRNPIQSESNPNPIQSNVDIVADAPKTARTRFTPPTLEEVEAYRQERGSRVVPQEFIDFYAAKNWMIGKTRMADWKAAFRNAEKWERWDKMPKATQSSNAIAPTTVQGKGELERMKKILEAVKGVGS